LHSGKHVRAGRPAAEVDTARFLLVQAALIRGRPEGIMYRLALVALLLCQLGIARAEDRFFVASDGVRLHYTEQGRGHAIVLVPGWTMPAWIFDQQTKAFSTRYRVIAFDPRGQGESQVAASGYEPFRRGRDIAELLAQIHDDHALLLGWSLGVLDVLSYVHQFGAAHFDGLVLVDNSVGEEPAPKSSHERPRARRRPPSHEAYMQAFVASMFKTPQPPDYLDRLTEATLTTPLWAAAALLRYDVPRSFWRDAVYSTDKPVLYLVRPGLAGQAGNLALHRPGAETVVLNGVGHAMFVDDPARFDGLMQSFIARRVWR
jgi:non-heme chloroperoxidase